MVFKSKFFRYTITLRKDGKPFKRISFGDGHGYYQTEDSEEIDLLMKNRLYGVDYSTEEEFPVIFPRYAPKYNKEKGNQATIKRVFDEKKALEKELADLKKQLAKSEKKSDDEIEKVEIKKPGQKKKGN